MPHQLLWLLQPPRTTTSILRTRLPHRITTTTFQAHFPFCPQHCPLSPTATTTQNSPRILPLSIQRTQTRPTRRTTTTTFQTAQTLPYQRYHRRHFPFCSPHCRHSPIVTTRTFPQTLRIPVTHQLLLRRHPLKLRLKNPY